MSYISEICVLSLLVFTYCSWKSIFCEVKSTSGVYGSGVIYTQDYLGNLIKIAPKALPRCSTDAHALSMECRYATNKYIRYYAMLQYEFTVPVHNGEINSRNRLQTTKYYGLVKSRDWLNFREASDYMNRMKGIHVKVYYNSKNPHQNSLNFFDITFRWFIGMFVSGLIGCLSIILYVGL